MTIDAAALLTAEQPALACPHLAYLQTTGGAPICWSEALGAWLVTGFDLATRVLRQPTLFSSRGSSDPPLDRIVGFAEVREAARREGGSLAEFVAMMEEGRRQLLLTADAPRHGPLRAAAMAELSPAAVARLESAIIGQIDSLAADLPATGAFDFVTHFAIPLPLAVIGDLLGLPIEERARFRAIADQANFGTLTPETARAVLAGEQAMVEWFAARITEADPEAGGVIAGMKRRCSAGDLRLDEAAGLCRELVVAGNESTTFLLTSAMARIASDDELQARLHHDPDAIPTFVEEMLRLHAPFNGFWRRAMADCEVGGVTIRAGDALHIAYAAANRDPSRFADPDRLEMTKPRPAHLAFGHGSHFCIGAPLARAEARLAIARLLAAREWRLIAPPRRWFPDGGIHGPKDLIVEARLRHAG